MAANYLPDQNKFHLAGPPVWWRLQLHDFDPSLVVVPSRQGHYYRLAQRKRLTLPERLTNDMLWQESDTKMLASYGLIPVTTIIATANWSNPFLFEELRRRAPHRLGGADKVIAQLEAQEAADAAQKAADTDARNTDIAKDAWGLYLKNIGTRSHMYIPQVKKPALKTPAKNKAPTIIIPH